MKEPEPDDGSDRLLDGLRAAERSLAGEPNAAALRTAEVRATLDGVEAATPGGAPLHSQLDTVRKWLDALDRAGDHGRFGGIGHLRAHVAAQLRLAMAALEDYRRAER